MQADAKMAGSLRSRNEIALERETDRRVEEHMAKAAKVEAMEEKMAAITEQRVKKGDVLSIAQLAGIQAAKRTADLVPLCHPLPIDGVDVTVTPVEGRVRVEARVRTRWRTGVEMEALTAVSAACLTVYDMVKAIDRGMRIEGVRLLEKRGGRSGDWRADPA